MGKPLSTVATLGLMKIVLILFNTLFWVRILNRQIMIINQHTLGVLK
jgi:hypothetical protein